MRKLRVLLILLLLPVGCRNRIAAGVPPTPAGERGVFRMVRPARPSATVVLPTVHFRDIAALAGLHYQWQIAGSRPLNILQTIGNGCAFLDYDNDGNLDILLVGPKLALYKGDGHGHFTDVTQETGLDQLHGNFLGCAVGDYDNDGYDDIYLSAYRGGVLLHNELAHGRVFRDVTREAGIAPQPWGTSCAWIETVPGSGRLDLYVCNYVDFGPDTDPQLCETRGVRMACNPVYYRPLSGVLYHNDGKGHFTDITAASGATAVSGRGLGVVAVDTPGSPTPALAIANDEMPGDLLRPDSLSSTLHYTEAGVASGIAYDRDGNKHGGMGIDCGDYNNDGKLDLFVATFENEPRSLYRNQGRGQYFDWGPIAGFGAEMAPYVAFGCKFLDYDNDGWLDLIVSNGHVQDTVGQMASGSAYREPTLLLHNEGGSNPHFTNVSPSAPDLLRPIVGRGLAIGDFDNDGRTDVLVVNAEGTPLLLHNECAHTGHWLGVRLIGTKSNRDGYGTMLWATAGKHTFLQRCHADGSYLSSSDKRVHFGLGKSMRVTRLIVLWPDGHKDIFQDIVADHYITLCEGNQKPLPDGFH